MKKGTARNRWLLAATIVTVSVALIVLLRGQRHLVEVATVVSSPLEVYLREEGDTRLRDRYVVSAPVAGRLLRAELEEGDLVIAQQTVVARMLPATSLLLDARARAQLSATVEAARAGVGRAEADLERQNSELAFARSDLQRIEALAASGVVSEFDRDAAALRVATQEDAVRAAGYSLGVARSNLVEARARFSSFGADAEQGKPVDIPSPVDGVVLRRFHQSERVVAAGEPLFEIGDLSGLEVVADFLSQDAVRIRSGDEALVERWGGPEALQARVRRVEPSGFTKISALGVEEQRVNVVLDLLSPPRQRASLGDGFRVEVAVRVWQTEKAIVVPLGALVRKGDQWFVFRVEGGRARERSIEVGERGEQGAEVLAGIAPGDGVILFPPILLKDGDKVKASAAARPR